MSTWVTRSPFIRTTRLGRALGQQAERAGGAERLLLAQVVDSAAERAAVAEVVLDDVGRGS